MLEVERILLVAHGPPVESGDMSSPTAHSVLKEIDARKLFKQGLKKLETLHKSCCSTPSSAPRSEAAIPLLEQALTEDATVPRGWYHLGAAYVTAGRYAHAEACFQKSLKDDGETPDNQYGLPLSMQRGGWTKP